MPGFTLRVLTFIKVSSSDCLLTRQRLCLGDNTRHSPVGPLRRLKIIRPGEERKAAWCSMSEKRHRSQALLVGRESQQSESGPQSLSKRRFESLPVS